MGTFLLAGIAKLITMPASKQLDHTPSTISPIGIAVRAITMVSRAPMAEFYARGASLAAVADVMVIIVEKTPAPSVPLLFASS
jgi:hypothetical protein